MVFGIATAHEAPASSKALKSIFPDDRILNHLNPAGAAAMCRPVFAESLGRPLVPLRSRGARGTRPTAPSIFDGDFRQAGRAQSGDAPSETIPKARLSL